MIPSKVSPPPVPDRLRREYNGDKLDFLTVEGVTRVLPVSAATVRSWIFSDVDRFASRCVVRRGRRVFVDRKALLRWLDEGRG